MRHIFILLFFLFITVSSVFSQQKGKWKNYSDLYNNPGNLKMYTYIPSNLAAFPPLVVLLHGCQQTAKEFAQRSGWTKLAREEQFILLVPEQPRTNNIKKCFNWFSPHDTKRDQGETGSIMNMINKVQQKSTVDQSKLYVAGFSAGGAMALSLLINYPSEFKAGAVFSGLPFGAASSTMEAMKVMREGKQLSPQEWENVVEKRAPNANPPYSPLLIFHGKDDEVVDIKNANGIAFQWTKINGIDTIPDRIDYPYQANTRLKRRIYKDSLSQKNYVEYITIDRLEHQYPVNPGSYENRGGKEGDYFRDVDFWGTYEAARFFDIVY